MARCCNIAITLITPVGIPNPDAHDHVNEFYKKGCQEKSSASTGVEIISRDPAHCSFTSLEKFGLLSILVSFSALVTMPSSLREQQASWLLRRQPWFYPRLVAYGYFWLSERA